jgi:hypothetical protein
VCKAPGNTPVSRPDVEPLPKQLLDLRYPIVTVRVERACLDALQVQGFPLSMQHDSALCPLYGSKRRV